MKKRKSLVLGFLLMAAILLAALLGLGGCGTTSGSTITGKAETAAIPPPAYADRLATLKAAYIAGGGSSVAGFGYSPGIVRKTAPEEVALDPTSGAEVVKDEYLVALQPGHTDMDFLAALRDLAIPGELVGIVPALRLLQLKSPGLDAAQRESIEGLAMVSWFGPEGIQKAQDSGPASAGQQGPAWYLSDYDIPRLQALGDGRGVPIAIVDSGIDASLTALKDRIVHPYSVVTASPAFEDEVFSAEGNPTRIVDHGTRVASMAASVAPGAPIIPIQVFGFSVLGGKVITNDAMVAEGIARAIASGARIINLSLGTDYTRFIKLGKPVSGDLAAATGAMARIGKGQAEFYRRVVLEECRNRGILVVCAAGNEGVEDASIQPLVASGLTVAVGAINRDGSLAGFSNRGGAVDCFAPGVGLELEGAGGTRFPASGTSFSSPLVAGVLALATSAGLSLDSPTAKIALRASNFHGRLSILPGEDSAVFYPAAFYRNLGRDVGDRGSRMAALFDFSNRYGAYFIDKADSDEAAVRKILGWYNARGSAFSQSDAEYRMVASLAPRTIPLLMKTILEGYPGDYMASLILAKTPIPPADLMAFIARCEASDLVAIVAGSKERRDALPYLHARLAKKPLVFNANTLIVIGAFRDPASIQVVKDLMAARASLGQFTATDAYACSTLVTLCAGKPDEEAWAQVDRAWARYVETATGYWAAGGGQRLVDEADTALMMVRSLISLRDSRALVEAARLIAFLDRLPTPAYLAGTTLAAQFGRDREEALASLQVLANSWLPQGQRYDYLASEADRKRQIEGMQAYFSTFKF